MESVSLDGFDISLETIEKLKGIGITGLYKVQAETYAYLKEGKDVITLAKTGSGKTLAFSIPLVEMLQSDSIVVGFGRSPRAIVLAPTRELVNQITSVIESIASDKVKILAVYGGVPYTTQTRALRSGTDVIVGAPGRVIDLLENNQLKLDSIKMVILDEVDRMLDMGFSADVDKILASLYNKAIPETKPQTMLFSATLPNWVAQISKKYLSENAHQISLVGKEEARTADTVEHLALLCPHQERAAAISDVIRFYCHGQSSRCIVFCERKKDADELASHSAMAADCHVFHGDIPQDKRELVLKKFREGKYRTLITTNVAARGLDIPDVEIVIQCSPPMSSEDYIHRSGRTGRAGRKGVSIVFYGMRQRQQLTYIERGAGITFRRISAPSAGDIVDVWGLELSESFVQIPKGTWSVFLPAARSLIKAMAIDVEGNPTDEIIITKKKKKKSRKTGEEVENGDEVVLNGLDRNAITPTERALCCALAKIAGKTTSMESRSLLTATAGLTAYKLNIPSHMTAHRKGLAYSLLNKVLPEEVTESIRNLNFIKGKTGYVFDLPSEHDELVSSKWEDNSGVALEKLTELPELEPDECFNGGGGFNSNFGGGGFRGRGFGGGFRGRGGGFRGRGDFGGPRRFSNGPSGGFRGNGPRRGRGGFGEKRSFGGVGAGGAPAKARRLDV